MSPLKWLQLYTFYLFGIVIFDPLTIIKTTRYHIIIKTTRSHIIIQVKTTRSHIIIKTTRYHIIIQTSRSWQWRNSTQIRSLSTLPPGTLHEIELKKKWMNFSVCVTTNNYHHHEQQSRQSITITSNNQDNQSPSNSTCADDAERCQELQAPDENQRKSQHPHLSGTADK